MQAVDVEHVVCTTSTTLKQWVAAASVSLPMAFQMGSTIGKLRGLRLPLPPDTHQIRVVAVLLLLMEL
jgi:hypothetical protein